MKTELYQHCKNTDFEITKRKREIAQLTNQKNSYLLELANKHYEDLLRLEDGTLTQVNLVDEWIIKFDVSYSEEKKIFYFQGSIFNEQHDTIQALVKKFGAQKRGAKILFKIASGVWGVKYIEEHEVKMCKEVIKYELNYRVFRKICDGDFFN